MKRAPTLILIMMSAFVGHLHAQEDAPPVRVFQPYQVEPTVQVVDTPVTDTVATPPTPVTGQVRITTEPGIDRLMQEYRDLPTVRQGYRVQIYLGDRKTAEETKRSFLQKHPDMPAYLSWLAPNFRLRVGDLRTRLEAERLLHELKALYPGSYIVPDAIEPPRIP